MRQDLPIRRRPRRNRHVLAMKRERVLTLTSPPNGNMTRGLDGKVMAYDGENRPLTVSFAGKTTAYVYGADGARLKKVETDPVTGTSVTLYLGPVEIRNYGQGTAEE